MENIQRGEVEDTSSERIENSEVAREMAHAQKQAWDSAMRLKRLADMQRKAGYEDLAHQADLNAKVLMETGRQKAGEQQERWEGQRRRKFEALEQFIFVLEDVREKVRSSSKTMEVSLNSAGVIFDGDAAELLGIGKRGYPPLRQSIQKGEGFECEDVVFPTGDDDMVVVETRVNSVAHQRVVRIMNRADASMMQSLFYNHIQRVEKERGVLGETIDTTA